MSPTGPLADWELDLADERLKDVDPEIWECRLRATITERDKRIEAAEKVIVAYEEQVALMDGPVESIDEEMSQVLLTSCVVLKGFLDAYRKQYLSEED